MEEFQSTGLIRGPTRLKVHMSWEEVFQSTGLIRGPTLRHLSQALAQMISIHRPHTRPDCFLPCSLMGIIYFNPQASYEARLELQIQLKSFVIISIHRPHTRPDPLKQFLLNVSFKISIHRPHTRPDPPSL